MSKSPFEDPSNPFQDPSITSALNSSNKIEEPQELQDEFTSFHHVSDTHDPYSFQESSSTQDDLKSREEALRQKERELADRERELEDRQRQTQGMKGTNNFPPCFPIMYLDITTEIPPEHQQTVWWIYREWLLFEVTLVLNFIACLCVLFSHPASVQYGPANMGIALTEMFTHTLASFFLWYRPVYNAYMKENSLYYCKYIVCDVNDFFNLFCRLLLCIQWISYSLHVLYGHWYTVNVKRYHNLYI